MLSRDHVPAEPDEKDRIILAGGKVMPCMDPFGSFIGPPRVWDSSGEGPGLMMSRSFGDQMGHLVGMTAKPEVMFSTEFEYTRVLVTGSDGLWEKMTEEIIVQTVKRHLKDKFNAADKICTELVNVATNRWNKVACLLHRSVCSTEMIFLVSL